MVWFWLTRLKIRIKLRLLGIRKFQYSISRKRIRMISLKNKSVVGYFSGIKLGNAFPFLDSIAKQNGLKLSRFRDFKIAKLILVNSIVKN